MSWHADTFEATSLEGLMTFHGESVTRWPLAVEADAEPVTAIVDVELETLVQDRGEQHERRGQLSVRSSQARSRKDRWLVRNQLWEVEDVSTPESGFAVIEIVRRRPTRTTSDAALRGRG